MNIQNVLRMLVIGGIFILPFIAFYVSSALFFPYITGKNFAFRIIVEMITGLWLALALVDEKYRPRRSWILAAFAIFTLVIAAADAQGANPFKSFWSNYERMDGWITLSHILLLILVSVSVLNTEKIWRNFWHAYIVSSVLMSIYSILQVAGLLSLGMAGGSGLSARVDARLGNPIYLAVYMLFVIFMTALLLIRARKDDPRNATMWTYIYVTVIALDTLTLFFTGTRGTILGLAGGASLALIIYALVDGSKRIRLITAGSLVGIIGLAGLIVAAKDTPVVKNVGFLDRLATISFTDATIKSRFLNMGIAWQGVKERPILGWGQENYAIVFDKYYDARMYAQEPWFDRVHDIVFDWLIAGGFVGLISYLSIFAATLWALWRSGAFSVAERSVITGLLAGYFFHNLTVFDNITSYMLFAALLAYIAWRSSEAKNAPRILPGLALPSAAAIFTAVAAVPVIAASAWVLNAPGINQNLLLIQAISPKPDINQNLSYFQQAVAVGSMGTQEVREQLAQAASQIASASSVPIDIKQKFFTLSVQEMSKQAAMSPLDARFPLFLGLVFDSYTDYNDAQVALQKAHELSPQKQSILYEQGMNAQARGKDDEAVAFFKKAFDLLQENVQARTLYASALIRAKQDAIADEVLKPLMADGSAADQRVAAAYAARNRYDKIAEIWAAHVVAQPTDFKSYYTLAAAYYANKQSDKAIAVLKELGDKEVSMKEQADSLIKQIQDGSVKIK